MNTHPRIRLHLAALTLLSSFILHPSSLPGQGSLSPPGAPAPTMKSLAQVEPRIAITNAGAVTISASGSYYLTTNITVSSGDGIAITANGVTLDLNGFTVTSTTASATGTAIRLYSGLRNITILNGFIQSGVVNNSGTYSGPGFGYGITYSSTAPDNVRVTGVSITGVLYNGIHVGTGSASLVESCTVRTAGSYGIRACVVKDSVARDCGASAIYALQASGCRGECSLTSPAIWANTVQNCYGFSSSGTGIYGPGGTQNCYGSSGGSGSGIDAMGGAAQNCYGYSATGNGLQASVATGCTGQSGGSGNGVQADTAENCRGISSSGTGLYVTETANNCLGYSATGSCGLYANTAMNCCGTNSSGYGLYAGSTAENCRGGSSSGMGLYATRSALNCFGYSVSGTGLRAGDNDPMLGTVENCVGHSEGGSGDGIFAGFVHNCTGQAWGSGWGIFCKSAQNSHGFGYGKGLHAIYTAANSRGDIFGPTGTGLEANIAVSCTFYGSASIGNKYLMP
jgi:hypothetical protein